MSVQSTAGTLLEVSIAQPATQDAAGYSALSYTVVGEITDLGEYGQDGNLITYQSIPTRLDQKLKGSINAGSQALQLGRDITDAGQAILKAAATNGDATVDTNLSFKITYKDGSVDYYQALVMSYMNSLGNSNQVTAATCNVELNTNIVEVAAP